MPSHRSRFSPPTRFSRLLPALLAALLASASVTLPHPAHAASPLRAGVFEPPRQAPEFALRASDGSELTLARLRGKVVLMSFGFSNCAAVCPTTLATLADARKSLGKAGEAVQVVFVTVDPERDDVARLKTYAAAFDPSFIGATGTPAALAAMRKDYGVTARKVATANGYVMDHSSSVYLIDRSGKLRALMPYGRGAADFVHDIRQLLGS